MGWVAAGYTDSRAAALLEERGKAWGRFDPVVFMAVVTPAYLVFELAFNASLLDITSSAVTHQQIENIECWGRIISGVALALFIWGMVIWPIAAARRIRLSIVFGILSATLTGSILVTFSFEKGLLEHAVYQSSPAQRRFAFQLEAAETAIQTGRLNLAGLGQGESLATPAGKAFLSLFPFMAQTVPDFDERAKSVLTEAVAETVRAQATPPAEMFNSGVLAADKRVLSAYQDYVAGERRRAAAINGRQAQEDSAWSRYLQGMRDRGLNYRDVPLRFWGDVRDMVIGQGVNVPPGWAPDDEATFRRAVGAMVSERADDAYDVATSPTTGHPLPLGMSYSQFAAIPKIEAQWRKGLSIGAGQDTWLTPETAYPEWKARSYDPMISSEVTKKVADVFRPVADFGPGGALQSAGRQAMESLLAPPLALAFSILGAVVHLYKASRYLLLLRLRAHKRSITAGLLVAAFVLCLVPAFLPNGVTMSPVFRSLEADLAHPGGVTSVLGTVEAGLCRWVAQAQPYFYPGNNLINTRFRALGFRFEDSAPQFLDPS